MLLRVETLGEARITCFADEILYEPVRGASGFSTSRYYVPVQIHAMSLIGNEQALRAIAASCSVEAHQRAHIEFRGADGQSVKGRWSGKWTCRAVRLSGTTMHMVAMPEITPSNLSAVVIPPMKNGVPPDQNALDAAIYQRLLSSYTTPLIPDGMPGQPEQEAVVGREWRRILCSHLLAQDGFWTPLVGHPSQKVHSWLNAGLLNLTQEGLDLFVREMVQDGSLRFPSEAAA